MFQIQPHRTADCALNTPHMSRVYCSSPSVVWCGILLLLPGYVGRYASRPVRSRVFALTSSLRLLMASAYTIPALPVAAGKPHSTNVPVKRPSLASLPLACQCGYCHGSVVQQTTTEAQNTPPSTHLKGVRAMLAAVTAGCRLGYSARVSRPLLTAMVQ